MLVELWLRDTPPTIDLYTLPCPYGQTASMSAHPIVEWLLTTVSILSAWFGATFSTPQHLRPPHARPLLPLTDMHKHYAKALCNVEDICVFNLFINTRPIRDFTKA
jgi:hypothetical protein